AHHVREHDGGELALFGVFRRHERIRADCATVASLRCSVLAVRAGNSFFCRAPEAGIRTQWIQLLSCFDDESNCAASRTGVMAVPRTAPVSAYLCARGFH